MAKLLKLRRGTTSQHGSFTGAEGEVTVDTTKDTLVVHDGSTAGGHPVAAEDMANVSSASIAGRLGTGSIVKAKLEADAIDGTKLADNACDSEHYTDGSIDHVHLAADAVDGDNIADDSINSEHIAAGAVDLEHMASESVDEDNLHISNAGTNGQYLQKSSNAGGLTWATVSATASDVTITANNSTDETVYPTFVDGATGSQGLESDTGLTYNPSTGLLTTAAVTTTGNVTVGGNLQVDGTTTTVNSSTMTVTDKNIEIAKGAANDAAADGAGITIDSGDGDKTWNWVDATDAWTSSEHIHIGDNKKLLVGTGSDLQIYHDASNSFIQDSGTGSLFIDASITYLRNAAGDEHLANFNSDGAVNLYHNGVLKAETTAAGVTVAGTVTDDKGDVRKIIQNTQGSTYTLVAGDSGKHILASGTVTIPNSVFAAGDAVTIVNNTAGDLTLTASVGTLYNTADAATGNRTLATRGMATILFASATVAYISGAGLS